MEVIFLKDLKRQGKKGEIKEVKDGYANNFLIKNGYAVTKNDSTIKQLNTRLNKEKENELKKGKEAEQLKIKLENEVLEFKVKTGAFDKVFGSISQKQIKEELSIRNYNIDKKQINIKDTLSSLGDYKVDINLYGNTKAVIKVRLVK